MLIRLPWEVAVYAVIFLAFGLYRGLWRFASLPDLQRIFAAVVIGALAVPGVFAIARVGFNVPRTVYLLTPLLLMLMMGGSRLAYRAWKEGHLVPIFAKPAGTPVIVLGAGRAAAILLKELAPNSAWRVVGRTRRRLPQAGRRANGREGARPDHRNRRDRRAFRSHSRNHARCRARRTRRESGRSICARLMDCRNDRPRHRRHRFRQGQRVGAAADRAGRSARP